MQENKTIRKRIKMRQRGLSVACMLLAAALTSCDEQPSPSNTTTTQGSDDSAAAYAALSATLDHCEDAHAACLESASDSTSARARCEREAQSCHAQAGPMAEQAQRTLERETHGCHRACTEDDAGPGGSDDADSGTGDLDDCIGKHAPKLPSCLRGLVTCLNDVGIFERAASRGELRGCVREAHNCIRERLAELRRWKRDRLHNRAGSDAQDAGPASAGTGGEAAADNGGSGGEVSAGNGAAGSGGADAGEAPAREERRRGNRHHHWKPFWKR